MDPHRVNSPVGSEKQAEVIYSSVCEHNGEARNGSRAEPCRWTTSGEAPSPGRRRRRRPTQHLRGSGASCSGESRIILDLARSARVSSPEFVPPRLSENAVSARRRL